MKTNGHGWKPRIDALAGERLIVDVGTSSLTGIRLRACHGMPILKHVAHPVYETLPLSARECSALGSDCQRVGLLYPRPDGDEEHNFKDAYGVVWLWADGYPAQLSHPLEHAGWPEISRYPRPELSSKLQVATDSGSLLVVADAPCPGLLDTCFALRNGWQFLDDVTGDWRIANALLDWALDVITAAYEHMLTALPEQPDIVVYGDDLGFQGGMYLSDTDFRNFLHPRLKTLISRIRKHTDAAICMHSCGGVRSILPDLADLGVEILNLDFYAKGMELDVIRREVPGDMILHGPVDLIALGAAAKRGDRGAIARFAADLAMAGPSIAAPPDNISEPICVEECALGAKMAKTLDLDDIKALADIGPTRAIVDKLVAAADSPAPEIIGDHPDVAVIARPLRSTRRAGGALPSESRAGNGHN